MIECLNKKLIDSVMESVCTDLIGVTIKSSSMSRLKNKCVVRCEASLKDSSGFWYNLRYVTFKTKPCAEFTYNSHDVSVNMVIEVGSEYDKKIINMFEKIRGEKI